jgi:MFS family permease
VTELLDEPKELVREHASLFSSLRYPGTKLYFGGLVVSMCGAWMQSMALSWLILKQLDGGGKELGLQQLFQFLPMALIGAWAGSLADRIDKRRLMVGTQIALGAAALALAWLDLTGHATLPLVLALSALSGVASAFDTPVRRSLIGDLVPAEALPNAMSLNTGVMTSSRVIGMALGGYLSKYFGTGWCFLLNGVSYLAMLAALAGLRTRAHQTPPSRSGDGVLGALRHVWNTPALRVTMLVTAVIATFTFNYGLTIPLMIEKVFGRDSDSLGNIMAVVSIGSFLGALTSARRNHPSVRVLMAAGAVMGLSTVALSRSTGMLTACMVAVPMGYGGGLLMSQLSGLLTSLSPATMRGRVLALQSVVFIGSTPFGGPLIGWIADRSGPRWGVAIGGYAAIVAVAIALAAGVLTVPSKQRRSA